MSTHCTAAAHRIRSVGTAVNFACSALLTAPALVLARPALHVTPAGIGYAALSGSLASGLGYALWYAALPAFSATAAAVAQLTVPVLAAVGAVVLLGEGVSMRLLMAGAAILGGVAARLRWPPAVRGRLFRRNGTHFRCSNSDPLTGNPQTGPSNVTRTPFPSSAAVPCVKLNGQLTPLRVAVPSAVQLSVEPDTVPVPEPLPSTPAHTPLNWMAPDVPSALLATV